MKEPEEESSEEEEEDLSPEEHGEMRASVSPDLRFTSGSPHTDCTAPQPFLLSLLLLMQKLSCSAMRIPDFT